MYRGDMEGEANTGEGVSDELMERDLDVGGWGGGEGIQASVWCRQINIYGHSASSCQISEEVSMSVGQCVY